MITGNPMWKEYYATNNPRNRLCFVDMDVPDNKAGHPPSTGWRAIANMNLYNSDIPKWPLVIPNYRRSNFLMRL